jgi:hypothetical protein
LPGAIDLGSTKFGAIKFWAIKFGAIDLASTKFGAIKFGAIKFGAIDLASTKFGAIKFGAIDMRGTKFGAIKFGAIPVADRDVILDCAVLASHGLDCGNDQLTLADAALVGALRGTLADIINLSDVSPEISDLTLADLFALVGIVSDLDALTIAEFLELSGVQSIYDLTLADFLPLLLDPGDLPWQLIDLDATPLQNAAAPPEPVLTFGSADGGHVPVRAEVCLTAGRLVLAPGTAPDGGAIADPAIGGDRSCSRSRTSRSATHTAVGSRAGPVLSATAPDATATAGTETPHVGSATVSVIESFELGDTPDDVKVLNNGVLVIAHLRDAFDEDLYTFTITDAQAAGGATADIYLSNLFVDYDLVLYGPPLDPLRGMPTRRINGFDDQGIDSTPADDVVAPDPLHDLFIVPPTGAELHSLAANRQTFDEHLRTGTCAQARITCRSAITARHALPLVDAAVTAAGACPRAFSIAPRRGYRAGSELYPADSRRFFVAPARWRRGTRAAHCVHAAGVRWSPRTPTWWRTASVDCWPAHSTTPEHACR